MARWLQWRATNKRSELLHAKPFRAARAEAFYFTLDRSCHFCSPIGSTTTGNISLMQRDGRPGTHLCPRRTTYHRLNTRFVESMTIHPPCSVRVLDPVIIVQRHTDTILILRKLLAFNKMTREGPWHQYTSKTGMRSDALCRAAVKQNDRTPAGKANREKQYRHLGTPSTNSWDVKPYDRRSNADTMPLSSERYSCKVDPRVLSTLLFHCRVIRLERATMHCQ